MKKFLYRLAIFMTLGALFLSNTPVFAVLSDSDEIFFSENNIIFYDPDGSDYGSCYPSITNISPSSEGAYTRLKDAVRTYGQVAMEMQLEYG
ncbi:MAG: hypothetical protein LBE03_02160, partial [Candidatus Nomurabacteria bacterium]|nr:hypothetical protein [Candidatus Nomurabacteria bacterium]